MYQQSGQPEGTYMYEQLFTGPTNLKIVRVVFKHVFIYDLVCRSEVASLQFFEECIKIRIAIGERFHPSNKACDRLEPVFLYSMLQPSSFAHMLRETLVIMYANLLALGLDDVDHRILALRSINCNDCGWFYEAGVHLISHYAPWAATNAETFEHDSTTCPYSHVLYRSITVSSLLFRTVPKYDMGVPLIDYFGGCSGPILRGFRDATFKRLGFPPLPPASTHSPFKVLFHDKLTADKRRIVNIPELVGTLRARFPYMVFDSKVLSTLSPRKQLAELGYTTILITPHGSSSYRSIFLPDGAQMISVGPDEQDGFQWGAWSEYTACWDKVAYYKHHCYHCTEANETLVRKGYVQPGHDAVKYMWWRSDKMLLPDKLGNMVAVAAESAAASSAQSLPNGTFIAFDNSHKECFKDGFPEEATGSDQDTE